MLSLVVKNRSSLEISADILQIAQVGAIKTRIMFGANLSYAQIQGYLKQLIDQGLLLYAEDERRYYATKTGRQVLQTYREMTQTLFPKGAEGKDLSIEMSSRVPQAGGQAT